MSTFRFKIIDRKTTLARVGTLDAPSSERAREHLEKQGYIVEWLRPASDPVPSKPESPALAEPSKARQLYRPTLADLWEKASLPDHIFKLILATGVTLGLVLLAVGGQAHAGGTGSAGNQGPTRQVISLSGEVSLGNGREMSPEGVTVTLSLPQIPFSQCWQGDQALDDQRLSQSVDFETRRVAGYAEVLIEKPGFSQVRRKQLLTSMEASIDLGKVVLEPLGDGDQGAVTSP